MTTNNVRAMTHAQQYHGQIGSAHIGSSGALEDRQMPASAPSAPDRADEHRPAQLAQPRTPERNLRKRRRKRSWASDDISRSPEGGALLARAHGEAREGSPTIDPTRSGA
jgi:hypothetical protein